MTPDAHEKAYIVTVDMGYGHQRAVFPLRKMAALPAGWQQKEPIISANAYPGITLLDRLFWNGTRKAYEALSRMHGFPFLGKRLFHIMNLVERIPPFYPRRDLRSPTIALLLLRPCLSLGFGRRLVEILNKNPLPLIVSFPLCAFMAEAHGYKGEIYCLCTDTDVARAWAPANPAKSRIRYLAPTFRVRERLRTYGVPTENIFLTGFPVPEASYDGMEKDEAAASLLAKRLAKLDPYSSYRKRYSGMLSLYIGGGNYASPPDRPTTVMFAVGGAGAQTRIGVALMDSLRNRMSEGSLRLVLAAGSSAAVRRTFERAAKRLRLDGLWGKGMEMLYENDKYAYFRRFNDSLPETDILWTKPSELSFYAGLGIPVIMTPPLGAQEDSNRDWLTMMGAGADQYDPRYANEWLPDWLDSGRLAHAAALGFVNASRDAADRIESIVVKGVRKEIEEVGFI